MWKLQISKKQSEPKENILKEHCIESEHKGESNTKNSKTNKKLFIYKFSWILYIITWVFNLLVLLSSFIFIYFFWRYFVLHASPDLVSNIEYILKYAKFGFFFVLILLFSICSLYIYQWIWLFRQKKRAPKMLIILSSFTFFIWVFDLFFLSSQDIMVRKILSLNSIILYFQFVLTYFVYKNKDDFLK